MPAGSDTADHEIVKGSCRLPPFAGAIGVGASGTAARGPSNATTSAPATASAENSCLVMGTQREQARGQRIVWIKEAHHGRCALSCFSQRVKRTFECRETRCGRAATRSYLSAMQRVFSVTLLALLITGLSSD